MRKLLFFISIGALSIFDSNAQINCSSLPEFTDTIVCPGSVVNISTFSTLTGPQSFNFNTGTTPAGWSISGTASYSQPCGANSTNTNYFWASTGGSVPNITTAAFDVSCGGNVLFEMKYAVQGGPVPCEGPDLAHEGVSLQYSNNGGATWTDITYYSPGGFELPSNPGTAGSVATGPTLYTNWTSFIVPLPPGAQTTSTAFRWIQLFSSGSCCDNWGLDNITINAGACNVAVTNWSNGLMDTTQFDYTATQDTFFIAYVYDTLGNYQCESDTIFVDIYTNSLTYSLVDQVTADCRLDTMMASVLNPANAIAPFSYSWSPNPSGSPVISTNNTTELYPSGEEHDTIPYYVTVTDGCGFTYNDSVWYIINQTLAFDTILQGPASCEPDGYVSASVVGATTTPMHGIYYTWSRPMGSTNPGEFIDASVWTDLGGGWYYIYVEDAVCNINDSIEVQVIGVPVATLAANPSSGCAPLAVTFTNSSQNSNVYYWDFGNGNTTTTNDLSAQSQSYSSDAIVQLIASNGNPICNDTTQVAIIVDVCGCMDTAATNYNPLATLSDNSCQYFFPTPPPPIFEVPNIFTPNEDGTNDLFFIIVDPETVEEIELVIIDRWGAVVFEETSIYPVWNGEAKNGVAVVDGTYFYKYRILGKDGVAYNGHGFIQKTD